MIAWALDALIGVTVAMLLVLAVRRPVAHHFGAGWAYALWLMPLFRLAMPDVDLFGSAAAAFPQTTLIVVPAAAPVVAAAAAPAASASGTGADLLMVLLALWGGGAAVFAMWQQSAYSAFLLSLGDRCRPARPPSHGGIPVVESGAVDGPLAVGLTRRRIVVPLDFETRYSPSERRLALEHELIHHRRGDIFWNYVALGMLALTWFSPVSWLAFRAFRTDQELACDAAVAARAAPDALLDYAHALVKSASRPGEIAACPLNRADQLKRRLRMIALHRRSPLRSVGGALALALLLAAGLAISSPGFAQEEESAPFPDRVVVSDGAGAAAVVDRKEAATLISKCSRAAPEIAPRYLALPERRTRMIVCDEAAAAADPAVRAIVARSMEDARREPAPVPAAILAEADLAVAETAASRVVLAARADGDWSRSEAAELGRDARIEAAEARREALEEAALARQEAMFEAAEARREAEEVRREAEEVRRQGLREQAALRRELEQARREAEQARREALREAAHARREADHARREAMHEAEEARREAAEARREAMRAYRVRPVAFEGTARAHAMVAAQLNSARPFTKVMIRMAPAHPLPPPAPPAPPAAPAVAGLDAELVREMRDLGRELERELAPLRDLVG